MLPVVVVKINYILNMGNNCDKPPTTTAVNANRKTCICCGKELPITMFNKRGTGHRNICISCERADSGASDKFKEYTSRELMEELHARGFKGTLKRMKVETLTI